jgi:hypothetical protein
MIGMDRKDPALVKVIHKSGTTDYTIILHDCRLIENL